jgi:hypothetical protein
VGVHIVREDTVLAVDCNSPSEDRVGSMAAAAAVVVDNMAAGSRAADHLGTALDRRRRKASGPQVEEHHHTGEALRPCCSCRWYSMTVAIEEGRVQVSGAIIGRFGTEELLFQSSEKKKKGC